MILKGGELIEAAQVYLSDVNCKQLKQSLYSSGSWLPAGFTYISKTFGVVFGRVASGPLVLQTSAVASVSQLILIMERDVDIFNVSGMQGQSCGAKGVGVMRSAMECERPWMECIARVQFGIRIVILYSGMLITQTS